MIPLRIQGANVGFGPPKNGKNDTDVKIRGLSVRREGEFLFSLWEPTPKELDSLNKGGSVRLAIISDNHPPVMVDVVERGNE